MSLTFRCPFCGSELSCPEEMAGRQGTCRSCGKTVAAPLTGAGTDADFIPMSSPAGRADSTRPRDMIELRRNAVVLIETPSSLGAGVAVSQDGLIVTNAHVADVDATYSVTFGNGQTTVARLLHRHPRLDLAVVKLKQAPPSCLDLRTECAVDVAAGDDVVALGHPHGLRFTSTKGIVSSPYRLLDDGVTYVQTDVAINPGNSGGPLLTAGGKLVGINTMTYKESQGLGFAIPASDVVQYVHSVEQMLRGGEITVPSDEDFEHIVLTPAEVVAAAFQILHVPAETTTTDDGALMWYAPHENPWLFAWLQGSFLGFWGRIGWITGDAAENPVLLMHLLKRNDGQGVAFQGSLDDEGNLVLTVGSSRPAEGLDVSEAVFILSEIIRVVCGSIYLTDSDLTGSFDDADDVTYQYGDPQAS